MPSRAVTVIIRRVSVLTLLGLVIGSLVGLLAVGFLEAILWLNDATGLTDRPNASAGAAALWPLLVVGIPAAGGLVVGLLALLLPGCRFHSPADAIRAAQSPERAMPAKPGVVSAIAACLSLGAGASVGQYGPLVHLGATVGSWARQLLKADGTLTPIGIACGAAAAISAAFHAPIAGLVFAREVVLRHYSLRAFAPVAVSSTMAYVVAQHVLRREPLLRIDEHIVAGAWEYLLFIAIGIVGALLATLYMRAIEYAAAVSERLAWPGPVKTMLAGLALGIVALQVPEILGIGHATLLHALAGDLYNAGELVAILGCKLLLTALCLGFGFAGGVFSPAVLIGTLFGALVGTFTDWFVGFPQSHIAVYAICGMVAVTSPVIGAPLTTVLIVFELTQNFDLAAAAMVSVAFANLIGFRAYGRSFFDRQLRQQGFDLSQGRHKVVAQQRTIRRLLRQDYPAGRADESLAGIRDRLVRDGRSEAHIVDASGAYLGRLTLQRLVELFSSGTDQDLPAGEFAEPAKLVMRPDESIWDAMSQLEGFVGETIPVLQNGKLAGVLFESTIVTGYLDILNAIRREENAAV